MILAALLFFVFGSIIGSFLNVVILRYGTGRGVVRGRSACPHCRHELGIAQLVPILSFLFLGGRCRKCRSKISWQYPSVEFLTGLLFLGVFLKSGGILDLIVLSLLVVIFVYDLKHKMIPDAPVYTFILIALIELLFSHPALLDLAAGPILFLPFFLLWFFSGGRWMGFGDAKLAIGMGWFLGFAGGLSAVVLGFWMGAGIGIMLLLIKGGKKLTIKSEIPFAPFLIAGLWLVYFFNLDPVGLHLLLSH